jgi:GNAT superfamily N-acetyltransferase
MAEQIEVRPFEDGDLEQVLEVLRLSLGEPPGLQRTNELFAWKHFENPFGRSLLLVAAADGRVAGFRAFMRWRLQGPAGDTLNCVRAVDTATHPAFQRRGVFRLLTLAGIDEATAEGTDLIFNTPNEKSGAGYLTMGWKEIGQVGLMGRPGARFLKRARTESWSPAPHLLVPKASPELLERAADHLDRPARGWRTPRTPEYLRWRFGSHPTAQYLLQESQRGVGVARASVRRGRRELVVSELGGGSRPIGALQREARPDYTVAWFSARSPERRLAIRAGLLPIPGKHPLTLMARPLRPIDHDLSWSRWDLSFGDLELL